MTPHQILSVRPDADFEEIKKAFRQKAKECHPDHHPDDPTAPERFRQLCEAVEAITGKAKVREWLDDKEFIKAYNAMMVGADVMSEEDYEAEMARSRGMRRFTPEESIAHGATMFRDL